MTRKEPVVAGHYYHIYNRGVNYQNIFFTAENWLFFLRRFRKYCTDVQADVIAYCLMPNHYHFLVFVKTDDFAHVVMQPLTVSYTKAINNQEGRVGPLFQGPFRSKRVKGNGHLIHLTRYIHLNPVTAGFVTSPEQWQYSSYQDYIGLRDGTLPKPDVILSQFGPGNVQQAYAEYVCSELNEKAGLVDSLLLD